jgi:hypothetical protein
MEREVMLFLRYVTESYVTESYVTESYVTENRSAKSSFAPGRQAGARN